MTPETDLEAIRIAYGGNRYDELRNRCRQMLNGIKGDYMSGVTYTLTEPQLSALLLMAHSYGELAATCEVCGKTHPHCSTEGCPNIRRHLEGGAVC